MDDEDVLRVARERFGYDHLRPGQSETIRAVLSGRDTLAVLPTGAGKSAIYQIAGLLRPGLTVVVSPLIALQRDQVNGLNDFGSRAAEINSSLGNGERDAIFADLEARDIEFLFLAPEQFGNEQTMAAIIAARPSLVVVDEAHCISEWGYDFRPDYLTLGDVIEQLGRPPILALTATAAPPVREEIIERLGMAKPAIIVRGFDRPNIHLAVRMFADEDEKRQALIEQVLASPRPGLVYAATRRATEELAALMVERGVVAAAYHAGLPASAREEVQDRFMRGEVEVIVATVAFGMGIDKADVRFVFHADVSGSIDAYYQEIGRAGRDGEPADATLFYVPEDLSLRRFQSGLGQLDLDQTEQVVRTVLEADEPVSIEDVRDEVDLSNSRLMTTLRRLEEAGAIELRSDGDIVPTSTDADPAAEAASTACEIVATQRELNLFAQSRVEMMRQYAETDECRRAFILNYFGEASDATCGHCDNCEAGVVTVAHQAKGHEPFPTGAEVTHVRWGAGRVMRYEDDTMTILFESVGYRTLALDVVQAEGLLT